MKIAVLNGPNLNLLGRREPEIYGHDSLAQIEANLRELVDDETELEFYQTNHEGELVDALQNARFEWEADGIVLNPGAFGHYSYALRDAIAAIGIPVIEVHLSNLHAREHFRQQSVISDLCVGRIEGLGWIGYFYAILHLGSN